ncbi:MAG: phosphatase PAP2 family protein [Candidatus Eisenbacteria bacterium]|uniref:Phosphatase PAP2 family protein n=1 Tax=Eiseniibacteriota bacterium TaxID=2212470 RepID=A0A956N9J9_UNCEI|nr:phosphatase PAP2 family protein [Candidatus Eisenbacteria bacterium]MCB9462604.1 phosphatase PAP2 family protein [Candidatus Eisenbacteria bacterium]
MTSSLEAIDLRVLELINQRWVSPWLDTFFVWLTDPPYREVYFVLAAVALIALGKKKGLVAVLTLGIAIALTDQIIAEVLKPAIGRVRPLFAHPDEVRFLLGKQARSPSMPSAHAANSFAVAVVLFEFRRSVGWAALVLGALVAYSRPYVGVHYPSDILVGAAFGTSMGFSAIGLRRGAVYLWRRVRGGRGGATPPDPTPVPISSGQPEAVPDGTSSPPDTPSRP